MKKEQFYSGLTSALCLDPGENPPDFEYGIIFSRGLTSKSVVVTVTPPVYSEFLSSSDEDRAEIIQSVYDRFL